MESRCIHTHTLGYTNIHVTIYRFLKLRRNRARKCKPQTPQEVLASCYPRNFTKPNTRLESK